jgi:hypothetical protein
MRGRPETPAEVRSVVVFTRLTEAEAAEPRSTEGVALHIVLVAWCGATWRGSLRGRFW